MNHLKANMPRSKTLKNESLMGIEIKEDIDNVN